MKIRWIAGIAALVMIVGACASPPSRDADKVTLLMHYISNASIDELVTQSRVPFLFDSEILLQEHQLRLVWTNLKADGLRIDPPDGPPTLLTTGILSDAADVSEFLDALSNDATIVRTESSAGPVWLLLAGRSGDLAEIRGIGRVVE